MRSLSTSTLVGFEAAAKAEEDKEDSARREAWRLPGEGNL